MQQVRSNAYQKLAVGCCLTGAASIIAAVAGPLGWAAVLWLTGGGLLFTATGFAVAGARRR